MVGVSYFGLILLSVLPITRLARNLVYDDSLGRLFAADFLSCLFLILFFGGIIGGFYPLFFRDKKPSSTSSPPKKVNFFDDDKGTQRKP